VAQQVAASLRPGGTVDVVISGGVRKDARTTQAVIVAIDARVDPATRNATVRAEIGDAAHAPAPGASVRVEVPVGASRLAVAVPASAVRKGPDGDHVFVLAAEQDGTVRARLRQVQVE